MPIFARWKLWCEEVRRRARAASQKVGYGSQLLTNYYAMMSGFVDPGKMIQELPTLILLVMVNGFILLKIPAMTATIFSGHTGGHDSGLGVAMMAIRAAM